MERWDSGLDPIGFLDLVPFVGRSFVHQHIEYFKLYCDAILGNQVGFEWGSPGLGMSTNEENFQFCIPVSYQFWYCEVSN